MSGNLVEIITPMPDSSAQTRAQAALARVQSLVIRTNEDYAAAATDLAEVKGQFKTVDKQREELKAPSLEACRRVDAFFKPPLSFLADAEKILKTKLTAYDKEQDRLRQVEQERLDAIARQERERVAAAAREVERKAREKAAEERRQAEAQRQAEARARQEAADAQARGDAAAAAAAAKAANEAAAAAQKSEAKADRVEAAAVEKSEGLQAQGAQVVAPIVQRTAPKIAGLSMREVYKFEITDPSKINRAFLMPDEAKIRKQVGALRADAGAIIGEGVRIWSEKVPASGAA